MTAATIPSFINKGQPKTEWPEWLLAHAKGRTEPNGSFLVKTALGDARVHKGGVVFEYKGLVYVCDTPGDARERLAELRSAEDVIEPVRGNEMHSAVADVADMEDDTDDISIRIATGTTRDDPLPIVRASPAKSVPAPPRTKPKPVPAAAARKYRAPLGRPPSIELRHPDELNIDDSYQRSTDTGPSRALIANIANNWDWRMCLPLVVSKRDGEEFFVIDGQHRLAAAKMRGDIPFLPCCVHVFESVAKEAEMFVAMNRSRRPINRLDDFHAAEASGDADVLAIKGMIERVGFTVSRKTGSAAWAPGEVAFTSAIAKCRRRYGDKIAQGALAIMADAFADQRLVVGSPVFTAICTVLGDEQLKPERDRLAAAVRTFDMAGWQSLIAECKGGDDRNRHLRDFLRSAYADAKVAA